MRFLEIVIRESDGVQHGAAWREVLDNTKGLLLGLGDRPLLTADSFARIQPFIVKEIEGIKVAIIGITTPGMSFWLPREFTVGIDFQHPVEPVRRAIAKAISEGANAIVLTGHMGLKPRTGGDDFANTVMALTSEFPNVAAFIAGHTHQAIERRLTNWVLFTQADHFGIHAGRVDLLFDLNSRKLLRREAICELMDSRLAADPIVLSRAGSQLAESERALAQPIGELSETLRGRGRHGYPSDIEKLIGAAITEALMERSVVVDAVLHGVFDENAKLAAGGGWTRVTITPRFTGPRRWSGGQRRYGATKNYFHSPTFNIKSRWARAGRRLSTPNG